MRPSKRTFRSDRLATRAVPGTADIARALSGTAMIMRAMSGTAMIMRAMSALAMLVVPSARTEASGAAPGAPPLSQAESFSREDLRSPPTPLEAAPEFDSDLSSYAVPLAWRGGALLERVRFLGTAGSVSSHHFATAVTLSARTDAPGPPASTAELPADAFDAALATAPRAEEASVFRFRAAASRVETGLRVDAGFHLEAGSSLPEADSPARVFLYTSPGVEKADIDLGVAVGWGRERPGTRAGPGPETAEGRLFLTWVDAPKERQGRGDDQFARGQRPFSIGGTWGAARAGAFETALVRYDTPVRWRVPSAREEFRFRRFVAALDGARSLAGGGWVGLDARAVTLRQAVTRDADRRPSVATRAHDSGFLRGETVRPTAVDEGTFARGALDLSWRRWGSGGARYVARRVAPLVGMGADFARSGPTASWQFEAQYQGVFPFDGGRWDSEVENALDSSTFPSRGEAERLRARVPGRPWRRAEHRLNAVFGRGSATGGLDSARDPRTQVRFLLSWDLDVAERSRLFEGGNVQIASRF